MVCTDTVVSEKGGGMSETMDFEGDSKVTKVDQDDLKRVADMARQYLLHMDEIARLEGLLELEKRRLERVSRLDIPTLMEELGMQEFTLKSGEKVQVKRHIKASITDEHHDDAFLWLRRNGHGSLIKNEVKAQFGRGEDDKAKLLLQFCRNNGFVASQKESVPWNTLTAFVKEQLEKGVNVPREILGVFEYMETKITLPKKK